MQRFSIFVASLLMVFALIGCSKNPENPEGTGQLRISLTDAPADFEAVNITFSEISVHIDSQWVTVRRDPITVNLLEWNNGNSIVIGTADVPAGHYTQIRLKIDNAEVVVQGQTQPVTVPSGAQTGLKLIAQFTVPEGSTFELVLDFDANRSIVSTGPPNNPNGYILKPTIRVVPKALTGSISGKVANPANLPVAYALVGNDTISSTFVDKSSGTFMLAFLEPGNFTVSVRDALGYSFDQTAVPVVAGSNFDLGTVSLSPYPSPTGTLKISLTDAPAVFEAVNITFSEISAHVDSQWLTVRLEPITVNLLDFSNGESFELAAANLPAGDYTQIRLKIDDAEVVSNGQSYAVTVPSGTQTGLKLIAEFTVIAGETIELILDFDAQRSIVASGPPLNPPSYKLKPTIRVIPKLDTGSISGIVSNREHLPQAYAIASGDTVASTWAERNTGRFVLAFLPEGSYTVSVRDTLNRLFVRNGIEVIAGQDFDFGVILLQ